jgi:prepilin peptidase CpaA
MLEAATLVFFPALMVLAAISDLLTMTISNRISIALVILFVVMAFACGLPLEEILLHLACGALMLVLTFSLFARAAGSAAATQSSRRQPQ